MAIGTLTGGWRIVHTMGSKITRLSPQQGVCAETGAVMRALCYGLARLADRLAG
jgi:phosphate/sulfate permease